jgi:hypothetical protein
MKKLLELFGAFFIGVLVTCIICWYEWSYLQKRIDLMISDQQLSATKTAVHLSSLDSKIDSLQTIIKSYESTIKLSTRNFHETEK